METDLKESAAETSAKEARNQADPRRPVPDLVRLRCEAGLSRALDWTDRFTQRRHWELKALLLCLAFTVLVSGGIGFEAPSWNYSQGYYDKIENPLRDLTRSYGAAGHDAKLNYRLTVPVVLHFLGLRAHWVLPLLTVLATIAIIYLSLILTCQITGNRIAALFVGLEVASTYIGSFGFIMCYDAIALAQVAVACLPRLAWYWRGVLCFTASFTDERGLVASLFILPLCVDWSRVHGVQWRAVINRDTLAIGGGVVLYFGLRLWLQHALGLGATLKGVGMGSFVGHIKHWHAGLWFALEGGWLLVLLAILSLWWRRQFLRLALLFLPLCCILGGGFMNGDLVRTTAYLFPAVFVALHILSEHERARTIATYCLLAFVISVVGGNYNVFLDQITWFMPLPVYLLNQCFDALVIWLKAMLGWRN